MSDERYSAYLNRIGNHLVLEANINTTIKNKSFDEKAGISGSVTPNYTASSFTLPDEAKNFLVNGQWDFDAIEQRQQHLSTIYTKSMALGLIRSAYLLTRLIASPRLRASTTTNRPTI